jgi:hypothetical protein
MKKYFWIKSLFFLMLLPLLVACGIKPNEDLAAPPEVQEAIYGDEETIDTIEMEGDEVQKTAGKPRLVEFYADW